MIALSVCAHVPRGSKAVLTCNGTGFVIIDDDYPSVAVFLPVGSEEVSAKIVALLNECLALPLAEAAE